MHNFPEKGHFLLGRYDKTFLAEMTLRDGPILNLKQQKKKTTDRGQERKKKKRKNKVD